jgi:hypothetical protein
MLFSNFPPLEGSGIGTNQIYPIGKKAEFGIGEELRVKNLKIEESLRGWGEISNILII